MDIEFALQFSATLIGASILIASIEMLLNKEIFDNGDWLGWDTARLSLAHRVRLVDFLLSTRLLSGANIQILRLAFAGYLLVSVILGSSPFPALVTLVLLQLLHNYRAPTGRDGSDQMTLIVLVGLVLLCFEEFQVLGIWFVGGQLTLSYASSGYAKLSSPIWRRTNALAGIFNTVTYGRPVVARLLMQYPSVSFLGAYAVIGWQCLFPISLLAPPEVAAVFLLAAFFFHASIALVMGLNTFLFSFGAAFPFYWALHSTINAALYGGSL